MTLAPFALAALVALAGLMPAQGPEQARRASVPYGFLGVAPQSELTESQMEMLEAAEVTTIRLPLFWFGVERDDPLYLDPDWSGFDAAVATAANHGLRVLPFVWGTPAWAAPLPTIEPVSPWTRGRWQGFLRRAVDRYGPVGDFWDEHPELDPQPIRTWQVWNEPNIVTFSRQPNAYRHARLVKLSASAIRSADPGARVLLAGMFAQPLEIPPNIAAAKFLDRLYRAGAGPSFDATAIHPYAADASVVGPKLTALRRVMDRNGDRTSRIWVTEMGWGSDSGESRWERGREGQARELDQAMSLLTLNRVRWGVQRVFWFSMLDAEDVCQFCDSAGLLSAAEVRKPAWYRFARWSGGVP